MDRRTLAQAAELAARGEPFVLATVVWREGPTSGRTGASAIIRPDGTLTGWLGGACAQPTVVREALAALRDGRPRRVAMGVPADAVGAGVTVEPMACASEGALEVYMEPMLPTPLLVVVGRSPLVRALVTMAGALDWRTAVVDAEGGAPDPDAGGGAPDVDAGGGAPDVDAGGGAPDLGAGDAAPDVPADTVVRDLEDLGTLPIDEHTFVVVATQGHYDEPALEQVLGTPAAYVGLVASARRADEVGEWLRSRGVGAGDVDRIRAPAGLDLGPVAHEEIAVAILAELIELRAHAGGRAAVETARPEEATDPVCGMTVAVASAHHTLEHEGTTYYFCAAGCQRAFAEDPEAFLTPA